MRKSLTLFLLLVFPLFLLAQEKSAPTGPAVGRWQLNLQKSDFGKMPPPKSVSVTVTADSPTALAWHATGIDDKGQQIDETFTGAPDGKEYPIKGSTGTESVAYTNENGVVQATSRTKDGGTINQTITMSEDKNTMTIENEASGPQGTVTWTEVYDRVQGRPVK